jgi:hypothetical protein
MNIFEVNPVAKQIEINYVEFNSAVWMYDLGNTVCKPNATSYAKRTGRHETVRAGATESKNQRARLRRLVACLEAVSALDLCWSRRTCV